MNTKSKQGEGMKTEKFYCDLCSKEIGLADYCNIKIILQSPPAQKYESRFFEHVCQTCRFALISSIDLACADIKHKGVTL